MHQQFCFTHKKIISPYLRFDTYMTLMKIVQFSRASPPPLLAQLRPTFFHPLDPGRPIPPPWSWTSNFKRTSPLHLKTNQLKENLIQRWLFYLIRSLLQVGFRFPTNSLILCDFPVIFFHLTEDNLDPRATCKN